MKVREDQLSRVGNLQALLTDLLEMDECGRRAVVVALDAISVSNTYIGISGMTRETESCMFLLNLRPIHSGIPRRSIHVLGSETGMPIN
jgi:hypothetical protein